MGLKGKKGSFTTQRHLGIGRCKASALPDFKTSRLACHGSEQAFIDGEGGSWDPYYYGIGPINKEGSIEGGKTTSLP